MPCPLNTSAITTQETARRHSTEGAEQTSHPVPAPYQQHAWPAGRYLSTSWEVEKQEREADKQRIAQGWNLHPQILQSLLTADKPHRHNNSIWEFLSKGHEWIVTAQKEGLNLCPSTQITCLHFLEGGNKQCLPSQPLLPPNHVSREAAEYIPNTRT